ncbi:MAG: radical SAM family heme chaperone HemW, partial [Endomicrobiales bacterium]
MTGLYIHIPFCRSKCAYCDFSSIPLKADVPQSYIDALGAEMKRYRGRELKTVYLGGGTPSLLSPAQIRDLGERITDTFNTSSVTEMTCEVNPESLTAEKISALQDIGVNRISMGLQSTDDTSLQWLGRIHSVRDFEIAYRVARDAGFTNIGIDLIYGLPGQTPDAWARVLQTAIEYQPDHMSLYALSIENGTPLAQQRISVDDDSQADMYQWAGTFLADNGLTHYEISNWATPGCQSLHNLNYWLGGHYIGIGAAAASCDGLRRWVNDRDSARYTERILAGGDPVADEEFLDDSMRLTEHLI